MSGIKVLLPAVAVMTHTIGLPIYLEQLREPSRLKAFIAGLNSIHLSGSEQGVLLFPTRFGTIT